LIGLEIFVMTLELNKKLSINKEMIIFCDNYNDIIFNDMLKFEDFNVNSKCSKLQKNVNNDEYIRNVVMQIENSNQSIMNVVVYNSVTNEYIEIPDRGLENNEYDLKKGMNLNEKKLYYKKNGDNVIVQEIIDIKYGDKEHYIFQINFLNDRSFKHFRNIYYDIFYVPLQGIINKDGTVEVDKKAVSKLSKKNLEVLEKKNIGIVYAKINGERKQLLFKKNKGFNEYIFVEYERYKYSSTIVYTIISYVVILILSIVCLKIIKKSREKNINDIVNKSLCSEIKK